MGNVQCCRCVGSNSLSENPTPDEQAESYYLEGKYEAALRAYKILLDIRLAKGNNVDGPDCLIFYQRIGTIHEQLENNKEALKYHQRAITLRPKLKQEEKPNLWLSYFTIGKIYYDEERYSQAQANFEPARDLNKLENPEEDDYRSIKTNRYRALSIAKLKQFGKALEILKKCQKQIAEVKGEKSEEMATICDDLANTYILQDSNNPKGNESILKPLGLGPGIPLLQKQLFDCAERKPLYEHHDEIERLFTKAFMIRKAKFYAESVEVAQSKLNMAKIFITEQNVKTIFDCLQIYKEAYGDGHRAVLDAYFELIKAQALLIDYEGARQSCKQALWHTVNDLDGDNRLILMKLYKVLGDISFMQGRISEAMEIYGKGLNYTLSFFGESDIHIASCYEDIAICFVKQRKKRGAVENYDKAMSIKQRLLGVHHPDVKELQKTIDHWQNFQWVALGDELSDRNISKNLASYRSGGDLSFNIEDFSNTQRESDGRQNYQSSVKSVRIVGSREEGEGVFKYKHCQDQFMVVEANADSWFFSVIDGHGTDGHIAAEDLRNHIYSYIKKNSDLISQLQNDRMVGEFLKLCFKNCENALEKNPSVSVDSGCCCLSVFIQRDRWYVCNAGDCKAILCSKDPIDPSRHLARELCQQHRVELEDEKARVALSGGRMEMMKLGTFGTLNTNPGTTTMGGKVETTSTARSQGGGCGYGSSYRVWKDQLGPGIQATRVLGNFKAKEIGIISTPEIIGGMLDPGRDEFLVAATDGLWDVMSVDEVTDIISAYLRENGGSYPADGVDGGKTVEKALIEIAREKWKILNMQGNIGIADNPKQKNGIDDIAVTIAFLKFDPKESFHDTRKSTSMGRGTMLFQGDSLRSGQ